MNALEERLVTLAMDDLDEAKKKVSRLEDENRKLEEENKDLVQKVDKEYGMRQILEMRIRDLGTEFETPEGDGGILKVVHAEAEQMATACRLSDRERFDRNMKQMMAEKLAQQLIDNNYVQFIDKEMEKFGQPVPGMRTVEAKMFVIPWDKTGPVRKVMINRTKV